MFQCRALAAFVFVTLVFSTSARGQNLSHVTEPDEAKPLMKEFADLMPKLAPTDKLRWSGSVESVDMEVKKVDRGLEVSAIVKLKTSTADDMRQAVWPAGLVFGMAVSNEMPIKKAIVVFKTPKGDGSVELPLDKCKAIANTMLKNDDEGLADAMFELTMAVINSIPKFKD